MPDGLGVVIKEKDVRVLPIFDLIEKKGNISRRDMFNTFNMGVGMDVIVPVEQADTALRILKECGEDAYIVGAVKESEEKICLI